MGILQGFLYSSGRILSFPHLARTGFSIMALIGPLVLLATLAILKERLTFLQKIFPFVIPAGIIVYLVPFYAASSDQKLVYLREDLVQIHFDCILILYAALINNLLCILYTIRRMAMHKNKKAGRWFYGLLLVVLMVPAALSVLDQNLLNSGLFSGVVSVLVLARSWQILWRSESGRIASFLIESIPERYLKSRASPEKMAEVAARIQSELSSHPYLDPDYSLTTLASSLGESAHMISQVFSQELGQNFSAFIAERRLAEARRMLRDPAFAEFSVLRIGFEAGFNSKSSFYELFRRQTGQTPAEFRSKGA